jgi:nicotinamidase-related amidase
MRFIQALQAGLLLAVSTSVNAWNRLEKDSAALLIIDHQVGLSQVVRDYSTNDFRNNMLAHAAIGKAFDIPVVMTTSSDEGPNGQMLKEILEMYPNVTLVRRQGEVNAWDNEQFRNAVKATGRKQLIVGGIVTEVCTSHQYSP